SQPPGSDVTNPLAQMSPEHRTEQRSGTEGVSPPDPFIASPSKSRKKPTKSGPTLLPSNWVIGEAEYATAFKEANWEADLAEHELRKFKSWHRQRKSRNHDWNEAWSSWCQRGFDYAGKKTKTGFGSALKGIKTWLDQQKKEEV